MLSTCASTNFLQSGRQIRKGIDNATREAYLQKSGGVRYCISVCLRRLGALAAIMSRRARQSI